MKILRWDLLDSPESRSLLDSICHGHHGSALTIGGFDGPHLGHQALFDAVLDAAGRHHLASGVVTFSRSPGLSKKPFQYPGDVSTLTLRLSRFAEMGFDFVILIDFSADFGKMAGGVFFEILVKTVCMRYVAVGPDFRCGHRLDTGTAEIEALSRKEGFRFDSIEQVDVDGRRISSSSIREAVMNADFALAERLLGHPFLLDFTATEWRSSDSGLESPAASFTQILPRRGTYRVVLSVVEGKPVEALLRVSGDAVTLEPAPGHALPECGAITTVGFRLS